MWLSLVGMQAPRQRQVPDFIHVGGVMPCPVSACAEFRQATPAVREATWGGRGRPTDKAKRLMGDGGSRGSSGRAVHDPCAWRRWSPDLKRCLLMPKLAILDSRVWRGMRSLAAA